MNLSVNREGFSKVRVGLGGGGKKEGKEDGERERSSWLKCK